MAKKVLIISTSLRGGSNSDILANECAKGAKEAGHDVELLSLKGKDIKYCIGCLSCQRNGMCVLKDDVADIMAKVKDAEVIVYATPIYYYEMCGQMKTLLDRLNPLYSTDYSFRDIYMIATAAENDESAFEKAYNGLQGWVDCFEKASLKGMVGGGGIDAANIAASHVDVMKKAYGIAAKLNVPVSRVYGVVTFYTFFTMTPKGKHPISVCMGTACYVRGSEKLLEEFKRVLGIEVGETTPDGKFSLDCLRCVGACGLAPVVMIGEKVYGRLQAVDVKKVLEELE